MKVWIITKSEEDNPRSWTDKVFSSEEKALEYLSQFTATIGGAWWYEEVKGKYSSILFTYELEEFEVE